LGKASLFFERARHVLCPFSALFARFFLSGKRDLVLILNFSFFCAQLDNSPKSCGSGSDSSADSDSESFDAKIADDKYSKSDAKHIKQDVAENLCSVSPLGKYCKL
jgi:hypothetical protein